MSTRRYPGLFGDPRQGRLWPALLLSILLHGALFWSFSRFHIRKFEAPLPSFYSVELANVTAGGAGGRRAKAPPPPKPPEPEPESSAVEEEVEAPFKPAPKPKEAPAPAPKPEPKTSKPEARKVEETKKPEPQKKAPPPAEKIEPGAKLIPKEGATAKPQSGQPAGATSEEPKRPVREERPSGSKPEPEGAARAKRVEDVKRRLEEQSLEEAKKRLAKGKESSQPDDRHLNAAMDAIKKRLASASAQTGGPGTGGPGGGGRPGTSALVQQTRLQIFREALQTSVMDNWRIPDGLEKRGFKAAVTVLLDRKGKVLRSSVSNPSGNPTFDRSASRAVQIASERGLLALPTEIAGDTLEVEFVFDPTLQKDRSY